MPKVSVIVTCYNYASYLAEAVDSVVGQTFQDLEIIIVNDGSSDDTVEVAKRLIDKYAGFQIKLIDQPNSGVAVARNVGISKALGEYVLPLDADDMIAATFLEETVAVLDANPRVSFAYTEMQLFGDITDEERWQRIGLEYDFKRLLTSQFFLSCNLIRKTAWAQVGGYKNVCFEDWEFALALGELGHPGKFIDRRLFLYRKHGETRGFDCRANRMSHIIQIRKMHPKLYTPKLLHPLGCSIMSLYIEFSYRLFKRTGLNNLEIFFRKKVRDPIKTLVRRACMCKK
jgi:glycosyltransferase involved in cell wall biosynthesis